jgi:Tat protein translocase TatB subunit
VVISDDRIMFGTLGGQEIILILVIALIVFGPRKLPEIGKSVGRMMAEFRKASNDFRRTLEEEVEAEKARPSEPAAPLRADDSLDAVAQPGDVVAPPSAPPLEGTAAASEGPVAAEPVEGDTPGAPVAAPEEPTVPREEPAAMGRPDGRPVEPR